MADTCVITDSFVNSLFEHPAFVRRLDRVINRQNQLEQYLNQSDNHSQKKQESVDEVVGSIVEMLTQQFRMGVDKEILGVYYTYNDLMKEIEGIKFNLANFNNPTNLNLKTQPSTVSKDPNMSVSIFSETSFDLGSPHFLDSPSKYEQSVSCLQDLNSSVVMLSDSLSKVQISLEERMRSLEMAVGKKIEGMAKNMCGLLQTVNQVERRTRKQEKVIVPPIPPKESINVKKKPKHTLFGLIGY